MCMTRPHEDLERHTVTDHRSGGVPIRFANDTWCAVDIAHIKAERVDAGVAAYETLIEKARRRLAVVLRSVNRRRVISVLEIDGHEAFRHLQSAWDDHHLVATRHDVAESSTLSLYRVAGTAGDASIDPETKDSYAFEQVSRSADRVGAVVTAISAAKAFPRRARLRIRRRQRSGGSLPVRACGRVRGGPRKSSGAASPWARW